MLLLILIILITLFVLCMVQSMIKPKKFPPGPIWYPFFGSSSKLSSLSKKFGSRYQAFHELSKEFSTDILGLNVDGELVVVFFGENNFKDTLLSTKEFDGRPDNFFMRLRCFGRRAGISLVDGPLWKIHRMFTLTHLRNAGFGKGPMEQDIQNELSELVEWITKKNGQPIWPKDFLTLPVVNVLWKCAAGSKIEPEKWIHIQELLQKRGKIFNISGGLLNRAPWTRFLLPGYTGYSMIMKLNRQIYEVIEESILKHKNGEVRGHDFINAFLHEMDNSRETFTEEQLQVVCLDLILAGSGTTAHAMEFAILQVLRDQEMQRKIQEEIDQVLGDRAPCWSDRIKLIYTSAFLLELLRVYTIISIAGPRRALKEVVVGGYVIPKNTTVFMSFGDIHADHNLWKDPEVFNPERYIDNNGTIKQPNHYYPFGLGRRRCPGDSLARMFLLITFTGLLQHFTITCVDDHLPSNKPDIGMLLASAKRFKAVFTPRKLKT